MDRVCINAYTLSCAAGTGLDEIRRNIADGIGGLSNTPWPDCDVPTWFGRVAALDTNELSVAPEFESRNNRLALLGLSQDGFTDTVRNAVDRHGAERCAVIIGTSTSSIGRTESAYRYLDEDGRFPPEYRQPEIHNPHSPAAFVGHTLGCRGPAMTVSAACSSSAKVFASAARWLACDVADAIVVGGVDSLCLSVIYGFHSLQLVAPDRCKPFDTGRQGINLGEAAGFALLTRNDDPVSGLHLMGYGESLDAYHMSSAHPEGLGARLAMAAAVERSNIAWEDVEYLNMHGTGTLTNDKIEGMVAHELFGTTTLMSATKGWTGHTLGAAGITEAVLTLDALQTGYIPGTINTRHPEPTVIDSLLLTNTRSDINIAMSNSFGFGGTNCSLVFGRSAS